MNFLASVTCLLCRRTRVPVNITIADWLGTQIEPKDIFFLECQRPAVCYCRSKPLTNKLPRASGKLVNACLSRSAILNQNSTSQHVQFYISSCLAHPVVAPVCHGAKKNNVTKMHICDISLIIRGTPGNEP